MTPISLASLLLNLRQAVHAADIDGELHTDPLGPGLLAIGIGGLSAEATKHELAEWIRARGKEPRESVELEFGGPTCNLRDIDLGIAVGSAAKTASIHSIDYDGLDYAPTGTLPIGVDGGGRHGGVRNRQQSRNPIRPHSIDEPR